MMISDNLLGVSASSTGWTRIQTIRDLYRQRVARRADRPEPVRGNPTREHGVEIPTMVNLGLLDASGQPVVTIDDSPVLQVSTAMMDARVGRGVLGGQVMRQFSVQLDYAAPMMEGFCLGCTARRPARRRPVPGWAVLLHLEGRRQSMVTLGTNVESPKVNIPATRIPPVTVAPPRTNHPCIVDTGATVAGLRSSVYTSLVSDGRAQLTSGITIMTVGVGLERLGDACQDDHRRGRDRRRCAGVDDHEHAAGRPPELDQHRARVAGRLSAGGNLPAQLPGHHRLPGRAAPPRALQHAADSRRVPARRFHRRASTSRA